MPQNNEAPPPDPLAQNAADIEALTQKIDALNLKFDAWQGSVSAHVEISERAIDASERAMEASTQASEKAMAYDNYVLTGLAVMIALAGFAFQKWANKSKKEAVEEAIKQEIRQEYIIAKIVESPEFGAALKDSAQYFIDKTTQSKDFKGAVREIVENAVKEDVPNSNKAGSGAPPPIASGRRPVNVSDVHLNKKTNESDDG